MHVTGEFNEKGYALYRWDSDPADTKYTTNTLDIKIMRKSYNDLSALSPEEAVARYKAQRSAKPGISEVDPAKAGELIEALDNRGAWVEEILVYGSASNDPDYPWANTKIQGISINSFTRNMRALMDYFKRD